MTSESLVPRALAVLADGESQAHAVPCAHVGLVEGVVGQVGQADKGLGRKMSVRDTHEGGRARSGCS